MTRKIKALKTIGHHRFLRIYSAADGAADEAKKFRKKSKKKTKFHLTKVLSYDMMVVARKYTRRKEAHRSG